MKSFRNPVNLPAIAVAESAEPPTDAVRPYTEEEMKIAFDTYDLDKNKFVGASEIRHVVSLIGEKATDEEIDEMVRMCDTDGDGQVTFDEFRKMIITPQMTIEAKPTQPLQYTRGIVRSDEEKYGDDIENMDLHQLMEKYTGGKKLKASFIKSVYKFIKGIRKDGVVTYPDFCEAMNAPESPFMDAMYNAFDLDGSGELEMKEFLVVLSMFTSSSESDKLKFSFMMYDEDGSGFLEADEVKQLVEATFFSDKKEADSAAAIQKKSCSNICHRVPTHHWENILRRFHDHIEN